MAFTIEQIEAGSEAVHAAQHAAGLRDLDAGVLSMGLCEAAHLILRPDQLYRFVQLAGCAKCATLARRATEHPAYV